jgi:pantoate--beta-alanine ligase
MNSPVVYQTIEESRQAFIAKKRAGKRIGFVPTMGALHAGHAKLIETARAECDFVVVSIFVNPTQFGPNEDFDKYPRTFEADRDLCGRAGADAIFAPTRELMYPPGFRTFVEVTGWQNRLCGAFRPAHFRGVSTVVLKLFHIVPADVAYFGQKDAQQLLIIRKMVHDLNVPIEIRAVPTVREADGLALSSRNRYLTHAERAAAPALFRGLQRAQAMIESGERNPATVEGAVAAELSAVPEIRVDYVRAVSAETLDRPESLSGPTLIALAAYLGSTRLIDNIQLDVR